MGEARRRKLADPMAAARQLASRSPGPVERFRVPAGCIALTLDVEGVHPSTCIMDPAELPAALERVEPALRPVPYATAVRGVAAEFRSARKTGRDKSLTGIGLAGMWLAFHHPEAGATMRERVSDALRREGKAHVTMAVRAAGLVLALAPQFVETEGLAEALPDNASVVYAGDRGPREVMQ